MDHESLRRKIHNNNEKPYGRTKANNTPCRKHPKHVQSPGVCSLCLNQKLSKLTNSCASSRMKRASPPSSSSSYISSLSSSDASSHSSPPYRATRSSTRVFKNLGQETLKKSRSMAFFLQRRNDEDDEIISNGKNKRGFWSRLLFMPRKNNKALINNYR